MALISLCIQVILDVLKIYLIATTTDRHMLTAIGKHCNAHTVASRKLSTPGYLHRELGPGMEPFIWVHKWRRSVFIHIKDED